MTVGPRVAPHASTTAVGILGRTPGVFDLAPRALLACARALRSQHFDPAWRVQAGGVRTTVTTRYLPDSARRGPPRPGPSSSDDLHNTLHRTDAPRVGGLHAETPIVQRSWPLRRLLRDTYPDSLRIRTFPDVTTIKAPVITSGDIPCSAL